jgi:hypothetical protein
MRTRALRYDMDVVINNVDWIHLGRTKFYEMYMT